MPETQLLAPADFPKAPIKIHDTGGATRGPLWPPELRQPNMSLLWHRYMPAHDVPFEGGTTPAGLDFSDVNHKREQKLNTWRGFGALSWFVAVGNQAYRSQFQAQAELLTELHKRRLAVLKSLEDQQELTVTTKQRMIVGQGNAATFENSGLAFDHTYGFPILPASSLKGLARSYLREQRELIKNGYGDEKAESVVRARKLGSLEEAELILFGTEEAVDLERVTALKLLRSADSDESPGLEGTVLFLDGWPTHIEEKPTSARPKRSEDRDPPGWLDVDVLTVHHKDYYTAGDRLVPPSDTDSPVPVHFLTVHADVEFSVPLALTKTGRLEPQKRRKELVDAAASLLAEGLTAWGLGAKTAAGYGRFKDDRFYT